MSSAGLGIGELIGTVSLNDLFSPALKDVSKATGIATQSFTAMGQAAGLVGGAMVAATGAIIALGVHGADVSDVSQAFGQLTAAAGTTAEAMLGGLREGSLQTISDFQLMKDANAAIASGFIKSADDAKTLAAGAHLLADRVGGDASEAFGTLTSAMATGRTGALKQLGIFTDTDSAVQAYANSVHKSVKSLSDHELATAKANAVMAALKGALDAAGPATLDFGDRINQGKAALANFTDNLAVAVANSPALAVAMDAISSSLQSAFGSNNQTAIQTISDYVTKFAIFLVQTAEVGVKTAEVITEAFNGTKFVFNALLEGVANGVGAVAQFLADFAAKAATAPGFLGDAYKPLVPIFQGIADTAKSMGIGFGEQAAAAVESSNTSTIAFAAVEGALAKVEEGMKAVAGAQVTVAASGTTVKKVHEDAAAAASHYSEVMAGLSEDNEAWRASVASVVGEVDTKFLTLMNDITMAGQTEVDARVTALQFKEQAELTSLANMQVAYGEMYPVIVALTQESYRLMTEAAQGHYTTMGQMAEAAGYQTRDEMQQSADNAKRLYDEMLASGKFTDAQLKIAHRDYTDKVKAMDGEKALSATQTFELIANAAKTFIGAVFGKGKTAAIATAIIDTAQAVVKALASAPPPLNYVLAAAVGVAGLVQINKIRSTDIGFSEGTPGTMFQDFGRGTATTLHGSEAVVTKAQGESVAGMVEEALRSDRSEIVAQLQRMEGAQRDRDRLMPIRLRDAVLIGAA